ncbi:hypothetical protein M9Y10_030686 [Tritrichomonas musculus]|uniref:Uncharacterized protein n=1 Tax=Tritrichomonas musculus TaxID=1915356 RepID=A0ABR2H3K8_9EUKA
MSNSTITEDSYLAIDNKNNSSFIPKEIKGLEPGIADKIRNIFPVNTEILAKNVDKKLSSNLFDSNQTNRSIDNRKYNYLNHLAHSNNISEKIEYYEDFGISSSDESLSDPEIENNDIFIPQIFFKTIQKTTQQQLKHINSEETILNEPNNVIKREISEIKQTRSILPLFETKINPESNSTYISAKTEKYNLIKKEEIDKIESIKNEVFATFETAKNDEIRLISEAKEEACKLIEEIKSETINKLKNEEIKTLTEIEEIKNEKLNRIKDVQNEALSKIENAKSLTLMRIQNAKIDALNKIQETRNETFLKFKILLKEEEEKIDDFDIESSDESSSGTVDDVNDVVVPKCVVDIIVDAVEQNFNKF